MGAEAVRRDEQGCAENKHDRPGRVGRLTCVCRRVLNIRCFQQNRQDFSFLQTSEVEKSIVMGYFSFGLGTGVLVFIR